MNNKNGSENKGNFMGNFLKNKTLSQEAKIAINAGLELWKYYHAKIENDTTVSVNASLYDIREYFQRRNDKGILNSKSTDETYNELNRNIRSALSVLAVKNKPKIYQHGLLKKKVPVRLCPLQLNSHQG